VTEGQLFANVIAREPLASREAAGRLLRLVSDGVPELAPVWYGEHEPLTRRFDAESALANWDLSFLWETEDRRTRGTVFVRKFEPMVHSSVVVSTAAGAVPEQSLVRFVSAFADEFGADFALVHRLQESDLEHVELFGEERVASAPCHAVERVAPATYRLQLIEDPADASGVERARGELKAHLGADAFFDPDRGELAAYRVPDFGVGAAR
jgi:hypothetical protein